MKTFQQDDGLSLSSILRNHLPARFPTLDSNLSSDEERQLNAAKDKFLTELILGQDAEARTAIFASDVATIEAFMVGYHARSAMAWLGIAFMVFVIVDKVLHAQHEGLTKETTRAEYFSYIAPRLKLEPSLLSNLYKEGCALEEHRRTLLGGTGSVPGVDLDFVARNRTKLLDFTEAVCRHDHEQALCHFREDTSRDFAAWAKYAAPIGSINADETKPELTEEQKARAEARKDEALARAAKRRETLAARRAAIEAEAAELPDEEKFIIRTLQSGMVPNIAVAPEGRPQFLDELPARLTTYRNSLDREVDARTPRGTFNPADPVNLAAGLGKVSSVFEAEERIGAAFTSLAERKRVVCILAHRLHTEPALISEWQALRFKSLQAYAKARLGMGAEIYRFAKIGRALMRYHYLVADLPDHDSESFFLKMEHVEQAIKTWKGDSLAVGRALNTLSPEDFKEFSRNPDFKAREFSMPVTQEHLDQVYEFRASMRHLRACGSVVRVVALFDKDEARYVDRLFGQMEAEVSAREALALANSPAVETESVKDAATSETEASAVFAAAV